MYILGIDPGFGRLGYGIIEYRNNKFRTVEYGCITTPAKERLSLILKKIEEDLEEVTRTALEIYKDKENWRNLSKHVMQLDYSWKSSAEKYIEVYKRVW